MYTLRGTENARIFEDRNCFQQAYSLEKDACLDGSEGYNGQVVVNSLLVAECPSGTQLLGSECLAFCPDGYKNDGSTCTKCQKYSLARGENCVDQCPTGFVLLGSTCYQSCPSGYVTDGGTCVEDSSCDGYTI